MAEGMSLQMKKFCIKYHNKCTYLPDDFLECQNICDIIASKIIEFFQNNIASYIKINGPDTDGHYPLFKLFEFYNTNKKSQSKE
jgi:hypothetical protein